MSIRSFLAVAALLASACSPPPPPADVPVSFANDIQPILTRSCAITGFTCHGPMGTGGGLQLDSAHAYANIVGHPSFELMAMPLIDPGQPDNSFLLHKIRNTMYTQISACNATTQNCGTSMPMVGGGMLTADEIAMFRSWIQAGAPNN